MHIQKFLITSALYLSLGGAGTALADDRDTERRSNTGTVHVIGNDKLRFTVRERTALEQYAEEERGRRAVAEAHGEGKQKPLPPGLQKKAARGKPLPPGWQKKLARGEVLPAAAYDARQPLPPDLRRQLPPDPPGTVTIEVDGEIVRILQDTREIIDILRRL